MLVLSRKLGEKIVINDNITLTIVDISQGRVRLGIEAPREVGVYREEVWKDLRKSSSGDPASESSSPEPT